jgi:hypothetical protein
MRKEKNFPTAETVRNIIKILERISICRLNIYTSLFYSSGMESFFYIFFLLWKTFLWIKFIKTITKASHFSSHQGIIFTQNPHKAIRINRVLSFGSLFPQRLNKESQIDSTCRNVQTERELLLIRNELMFVKQLHIKITVSMSNAMWYFFTFMLFVFKQFILFTQSLVYYSVSTPISMKNIFLIKFACEQIGGKFSAQLHLFVLSHMQVTLKNVFFLLSSYAIYS